MTRLRWARSIVVRQPGLAMGAMVGLAVALASSTAFGHRLSVEGPASLEVTHLPPLLRAPDDPGELRYDVFCVDADEIGEPSCNPTGTVFVRRGTSGPFEPVPVRLDPSATEGRFVASVPAEVVDAPDGFSYYATFSDPSRGATATHPAGGAAAPQRSLPLNARTLELGPHAFGKPRRADARILTARWGEGPGRFGLEGGTNATPIGGSSFDVDPAGNVYILDQVNRRVLSWRRGSPDPVVVPVPVQGTIADIAVEEGGSVYVLESVAGPRRSPLVRRFDGFGRELEAVEIAERPAQIRMGPDGPLVLQHPSGQWMPATRVGVPVGPEGQRRLGRSGRALTGGREIVVLRHEKEVRVAIVGPRGVHRSWRITSDSPLAEVQLAEPLGAGVVVVVRAFDDERDEFLVLVLDEMGIAKRFAVAASDWAETAPLARFRLVRSSLYRLGSSPEGLFVDRFDLEVR